jgi:hypothetical protein
MQLYNKSGSSMQLYNKNGSFMQLYTHAALKNRLKPVLSSACALPQSNTRLSQ